MEEYSHGGGQSLGDILAEALKQEEKKMIELNIFIITDGKKIEAVKQIRALLGTSLVESKELVERFPGGWSDTLQTIRVNETQFANLAIRHLNGEYENDVRISISEIKRVNPSSALDFSASSPR